MTEHCNSNISSKIHLSHELFFESSPDCIKVLDARGTILSMNKNGQCLMEIDDFNSICGSYWPDLWPQQSHETIHSAYDVARAGGTGHFVAFCPTAKGTPKWWDVRVTPIRGAGAELDGFLSVSRDVTALREATDVVLRDERFSKAQKSALELAVSNAPLSDVLDRLACAAESYSGDAMLASVLLLDSDGKTVRVGAAPSLPASYSQAIDGASIGPAAGSCGTAAYRKEPVFVRDIQNDPLWADYKALAASHSLAACWSVPIISADGKVYGTFAFYYRVVRDPTLLEIQAMQMLVHTATLVLEKHCEAQQKRTAEKALRDSEAKFRSITNAMPQVVWSTRPDGFHDYYNDRWYEFTGVPHGSTDGEGWNDLFHPDDQPRAWELWQRSLETGEPYEIEYRLRHHTGLYRWTLGRAVPVRDESGKITRWMGTCTDIHEQRITHEVLQQADRRKDEFLAMLAHELRNPLAPIAAAAHLLSMGNLSEARLQRLSEVVARQAEHMKDLIDDLLDVSRVTRGLITLEKEPVDVKSVASEAIEQVRSLIDARSHHLETYMSSDSAIVSGDKNRLIQIMANLLTNAAKYTPNSGRITLRIDVDDKLVTFSVRDNGIGMPADLLANAFEMFAQGARTPDRSQGGLGIGLALVKSLVHLHNGTVDARSSGEGQGSEFLVSIPRIHQQNTYSQLDYENERGVPRSGTLRVMVVDDNTDAAQLLAMFVEDAGHKVFVEHRALKAIECAQKVIPDVCILDIGLPDIDGNELARRLRALPETKDAVLVAVTGYGQRADIEASMAAGFDHHFVKPADTKRLETLLVHIVLDRHPAYHDVKDGHNNNYLH
jgi:PAS domain S-box-containing protein